MVCCLIVGLLVKKLLMFVCRNVWIFVIELLMLCVLFVLLCSDGGKKVFLGWNVYGWMISLVLCVLWIRLVGLVSWLLVFRFMMLFLLGLILLVYVVMLCMFWLVIMLLKVWLFLVIIKL